MNETRDKSVTRAQVGRAGVARRRELGGKRESSGAEAVNCGEHFKAYTANRYDVHLKLILCQLYLNKKSTFFILVHNDITIFKAPVIQLWNTQRAA